jgi:hypothetical protein
VTTGMPRHAGVQAACALLASATLPSGSPYSQHSRRNSLEMAHEVGLSAAVRRPLVVGVRRVWAALGLPTSAGAHYGTRCAGHVASRSWSGMSGQ